MEKMNSVAIIMLVVVIFCSGCAKKEEEIGFEPSKLQLDLEQGQYDDLNAYFVNDFSMTCSDSDQNENNKLNVVLSDEKVSIAYAEYGEGDSSFNDLDHRKAQDISASYLLTNVEYIKEMIDQAMSIGYVAKVELVSSIPIKLNTDDNVMNLVDMFDSDEGIYLLVYNVVDLDEHFYIRIE